MKKLFIPTLTLLGVSNSKVVPYWDDLCTRAKMEKSFAKRKGDGSS